MEKIFPETATVTPSQFSDEWSECPLCAIDGWIFAWMVWVILMADFAGATGHIVLAFVNLGMPVFLCGRVFWVHAQLAKLLADLEGVG